jgi:hypothetical protein
MSTMRRRCSRRKSPLTPTRVPSLGPALSGRLTPSSHRSYPRLSTLSPCHPTTTSALSSTFAPRHFLMSARARSFLRQRTRCAMHSQRHAIFMRRAFQQSWRSSCVQAWTHRSYPRSSTLGISPVGYHPRTLIRASRATIERPLTGTRELRQLISRCFGCQCRLGGLEEPRPPAQLVRILSLFFVISTF